MAFPAGFLAQETVVERLASLALCLVLYGLQTKNCFYIFKRLPGVFPPSLSVNRCFPSPAPGHVSHHQHSFRWDGFGCT